jgi:PAS domain S-box-containing protein
VRKEDISQEKIWQESANLLAHAYMFPEIAACCITWGGREFSTGNFKKTIWSQSREIMIHDEWAGNIEVCYLEERPKESEGPFLAEERKLIDAVADLLGKSSERKETEAALRVSEQKLTTLFKLLPVGISVLDSENKVVHMNPTLNKILDLAPEELLEGGYRTRTYLRSDGVVMSVDDIASVRAIREQAAVHDVETGVVREDGQVIWVNVSAVPVDLSDWRAVIVMSDITERKRAEEKVKSLLKGKELLLKEIHHGIKNNMDSMMSLLSFHAQTLARTDIVATAALNDAVNRLRNMGVLYYKLYQFEHVAGISLKDYLRALVGEIIAIFPTNAKIDSSVQGDDFEVGAMWLSPLGIIINELITNIMKHAFIGRFSGVIAVTTSMKDGHATIVVQDDGVGIPESVDIGCSAGFGLQLVDMLAKQLDGKIRIERSDGTRFVLEFDV